MPIPPPTPWRWPVLKAGPTFGLFLAFLALGLWRGGTVALEIAIRALGLKGEVIVPAFTFVATAHALRWQEITPVFADVCPRSHQIDPESVRRLITPRTTGMIGV